MSATLKLGTDGNWAAKKGSVLSYNDENNNFKPLPFNFTRNSSATRVNKAGLIETVGAGEPRIDFKDNTKGSLLLEPQRSNLVTYSEDLTQWSNLFYTLVQSNSTLSPDGNVNADKLVAGATNGLQLRIAPLSLTSGNTYTFSTYVKNSGGNYVILYINDSSSQGMKVDLVNETFVIMGSATNQFIKNFGNGWYQIGFTRTIDANVSGLNTVASLDGNNVSFLGDGVNGVYLWGAQVEQGSYATSYIPTSGGVVTRSADSTSQTPPSGIIGQTEGVAYVEIDWKGNDEESIFSILHDGTVNNRMHSGYSAVFNSFYFNVRTGGSGQGLMQYASPTIGKYKIAISYKNNDFALWVNGVKEAVDNSGSVPVTTQYNVGNYIGGDREHSIINSKLYNTALTDQELIALTTI